MWKNLIVVRQQPDILTSRMINEPSDVSTKAQIPCMCNVAKYDPLLIEEKIRGIEALLPIVANEYLNDYR